MTEEYLAWGIRKSDTVLRNSANAFLKAVSQSGKLDEILQRRVPR
jgi:ABC-type amino acid transport substrate-binding protein